MCVLVANSFLSSLLLMRKLNILLQQRKFASFIGDRTISLIMLILTLTSDETLTTALPMRLVDVPVQQV